MSKYKSHFTPIQVNSDIKQPLEKVLRQGAQKRWRKLWNFKLLPFVYEGEKFIDGEPENEVLKRSV
jgi:hypothetical protein